MTTSQLSITYSGQASAASRDLLQLEQSPWGAYTSRVTRAEMIRYLSAQLFGTEYRSSVNCGLVSGEVVCVVAAYPREADLVYRLRTSHGALSSPAREMPLLTEALSFRLTTELTPAHPVREIRSVEWISECYNAEGAVVDPPPLSTDGETITIPFAVYGSVNVTYRTERHSYVLTAPRRAGAIDNFYSAAVYGVYCRRHQLAGDRDAAGYRDF